MAIHTVLWKVGAQPTPLVEATLDNEQLLEEMIVADPRVLSDEWMLVGRQVNTGLGGRLDLLAIAPDASLVLIELKRDRTPRAVVAQALDYAYWVDRLAADEVVEIYERFRPGRSLADEFHQRFGQKLDEDSLNETHQIVIVAASLDSGSERIVSYLSDRDIPINVLCFQVFANGEERLLSRAWLLDPVRAQTVTGRRAGAKEPWNGEFYCSFGHGDSRSWPDALKYGFISAGGGAWYSRTLQLLEEGDGVWVNIPGTGYVGVGCVTGSAEPASTFEVTTPEGSLPILDVAKGGTYQRETEDPERAEYFVPVSWLQTVALNEAVHEIGFFGNQNSVCKPTTTKWRTTVERLKEHFPDFDKPCPPAG